MKNLDRIFFGLVLGFFFPIFLMLLIFVMWFYLDKNTDNVIIYILSGLVLGVVIDFKYLKRWISHRYELPIWFIIGIYFFYNIVIYGFFMGFPVFNVGLGLVAGYYYGKRIRFLNIAGEKHSKIMNHLLVFTGFIMTLICISSGFLALEGRGVGGEIQAMLGLGFEVTKPMILGMTLVGGFLLILIQVLLTRLIMIKILKGNNQ
jgi:hypothetical protein